MATVKNLKLDEITLEYNSFVDSQVLTAKQLNDIVDFFEDQQRLTRTCLIGVGLVCGLSIKGNANGITVSKGCGVTTDGDLLYLPEITYKHFKAYDNSLIKYPPFYPLGTDSAQMLLWELLPDASATLPTDSKPLSQFNTASNKELSNMVALLYLEYFEKEPDACTAIDCDNQGKKQVAKPKVLLLTKEDMDQIIARTSSEIVADDLFKKYFDAYTAYFDLPVLGAKRVFINSSSNNSSAALTSAYTSTAKSGLGDLSAAIEKVYQTFRFVLDPNTQYNISTIKNTLSAIFGQAIQPVQAQYFYDFYKDLVAAYNELRAILSDIIYQCCPDLYSFPKHIMLGALNTVPAAKPTPHRHIFYPSPIVSKNKKKLDKAKMMLDRLVLLINGYNVPNNGSTVRITPSYDYDRQLEKRAIPFYYQNTPSLVGKWNFERTQQGTEKQTLSYRASTYASNNDMVISPLSYSIDGNDFFRIEGHMGRTYQEAIKLIDSLRKENNLPFDLVAIRLGDAQLRDVNMDNYRCQFEDLEAVLKAWQAEQKCLFGAVTRFFSSFNTRTGTKVDTKLREQATKKSVDTGRVRYVAEMARATLEAETSSKPASFLKTQSYVANYGGSSVDTVDLNLSKEPYFIGNYVDKVLKEGRAVGIADFAEEVSKEVDTSMLGADDIDIIVNIPVRVIAAVRKLSEWTPDRITDIGNSVIGNYRTNLEALCQEVKSAQKKAQSIFNKQAYATKGYEADYELILWQLSENCCADEKLEVFQQEIQQRKENILKQLTFANYAARHPGLEHKAGVPAGGTFVLAYTSTTATAGIAIVSIAELKKDPVFLAGFADADELAEYLGRRIETYDILPAINLHQEITGTQLSAYDLRLYERKITAVIQARIAGIFDNERQSTTSTTVVADFCLPYICCSDCPPVAFIIPEPKVSLSLPKAFACSDEPLLLFRANPADGTVKASEGFAATVVEKENMYYFDPSKVKDGKFGQPITFTLNDQVTDCTITVIKHPDVKPSALQKAGEREILVMLDAETNQKAGDSFTYTWTLGDGRVQSGLTEPKIQVSYVIDDLRKSFPNGILELTLTATNQQCSSIQSLELAFDIPAEQPELKLATDIVCSDAGPVAFTDVKPENGFVTSKSVPDRVKKVNGQWVFDPAAGPFNKKINDFMINDQHIPDCAITIFEHPAPSFTYKLETVKGKQQVMIHFENTTPNADSFSFLWDMNKEGRSEEVSPTMTVEMANYPRGRTVSVRLAATNKKNERCRATTPVVQISLQGVEQIVISRGDLNLKEVLDISVRKEDIVTEDPKTPKKQIKKSTDTIKPETKNIKATRKTKKTDNGPNDTDRNPK